LVSDGGSHVVQASRVDVLALQVFMLTPWEFEDASVVAEVLWGGRMVEAADYGISVVPGELVAVRMRPREREARVPDLAVGLR